MVVVMTAIFLLETIQLGFSQPSERSRYTPLKREHYSNFEGYSTPQMLKEINN